MPVRSRTALRALLGIAISVIALWIVFGSVDLAKVGDALRTANPIWIVAMIAFTLLDVAARGARWQMLLRPIAVIPYRRVLGYTYLGYLANNVLPARLGELVRSHALGEGEGLSRTTVLGTIVVERIVDTALVVAIAATSVLLLGVTGVVGTAVTLGFAFVAVLIGALALAVVAHRLPGADRVAAVAARWPIVVELARRLRDGLAVVRSPKTLIAAIGYSALAWATSIATFFAGANAVGIGMTVPQAALTGSSVALSTIVPSGPGYLGTFELTAKGIATGFGLDGDRAFAMAILVHAVLLSVTSVGGVIALLARRARHETDGTPNEDSAILRS